MGESLPLIVIFANDMKTLKYGTLLATVLGSGTVFGQNAENKNVLFILVDDYGWADVSYNGSTFYETPNIDRLAGEGMTFTNGYAAAAISSPSRCGIMTGRYPARLHITDWIKGYQDGLNQEQLSKYKMISPQFVYNLPLEEITIAEALKDNGYKTCLVGKWHCSDDSLYYPQYQGFDENIGGWGSGSPKGNSKEGLAYYVPYNNPYLKDGPKGEFLTDRLGDEAAGWIEKQTKMGDDPFFVYLSFYAVHTPIQPKPEYAQYFRQKAKKMGLDTVKTFSTDFDWYKKHPKPAGHWKERLVQNDPEYAALIKSMDENIGKVLDKLVELGLDKNTIICFTSDNGGLSTAEGSPTTNAPLRAGKGWLYEGGIREPFVIKNPGVTKAGDVCDAPVVGTDFFPTILEACGIDYKAKQALDGVSLMPLLEGKEIDRKAIYWHYPHYGGKGDAPAGAIRCGDFKLIEFFEDGKVELYNLKDDISEKNDIAKQNPTLAKTLLKDLQRWRKEINAQMPTTNENYKYRQ